jgi:hypothetical protein
VSVRQALYFESGVEAEYTTSCYILKEKFLSPVLALRHEGAYGHGNNASRILNEIHRYAHNIHGTRNMIVFTESSMKNNLPFT